MQLAPNARSTSPMQAGSRADKNAREIDSPARGTHGHDRFATCSGEAGSRNFSVQNTRDSPSLVTQNCATLVRSVEVDQHISASSDESCPGRSSEVGVGGGVATTMLRRSRIETVWAFANRRWSLGANFMQRCSAGSTAVVDPVADDVASAVLISTIDVVVSSGARVAVSEHDAPTNPNITIATKPIVQSARPVRPLRIRSKERILPLRRSLSGSPSFGPPNPRRFERHHSVLRMAQGSRRPRFCRRNPPPPPEGIKGRFRCRRVQWSAPAWTRRGHWSVPIGARRLRALRRRQCHPSLRPR